MPVMLRGSTLYASYVEGGLHCVPVMLRGPTLYASYDEGTYTVCQL